MKQTLTEKILARAAGRETVSPGENVWAKIDVLLTHDVCGPGTIGIFKREFGADAKVFDRGGVVIIPDHYIHTRDEKAHRNVATLFIPALNGCVTTVWFMWGGIKDIRALLRDLAARERNELDNGMVSEDHVSLADQAIYAAREAGEKKE